MSDVLPNWSELPFFAVERERFARLAKAGRLPPVTLLEGRRGLGKELLAAQIAAMPFCSTSTGCGECGPCREVMAGHQDEILWVASEDGKLKIEHAEMIQEHLSIRPARGAMRTVVIVRCEELLKGAANRLLKTLEEPPSGARILMTSDAPRSLLPTILSRTVRWRLAPPPVDAALAYLRASYPDGQDETLRQALARSGMVPRVALERLRGEAPPDLWAEVDMDPIAAGERLGRKKDWDATSLLDQWEIALNREYRAGRSASPLAMHRRRAFAKRVRGLLKANVPVNRQMLVEQLRKQGN